ncbi:uncharacterized protein LOC142221837 isoform X2 [Haematobia irritans]|uniref:uncharacterized protein LOC142221837 isoform X2 n=1 Tax=Haematobia irritans TaxID=7368 RepID=UPI003F50B94B
MDTNTPKMQRKSSLSLTTRLNKKRHSASPQNVIKTTASNNRDSNIIMEVPRSPSVLSVCSDGGIECCTPPHKKNGMYVDDCGDYSPKIFDSSFSPSCLLSQTLAIDSPEVGWKWSRYSAGSKEEVTTRTPDSAYAADSSFTSAGSSSTEVTSARTRIDTYQQRMAYDALREQQMRKVEKSRADQKLKLRCARLQEQLKGAGTQKSGSILNNSCEKNEVALSSTLTASDIEMSTCSNTASTVKVPSPTDTTGKASKTLNDFFNDSDEDCFLLAATQEIESKLNVQKDPPMEKSSSTKVRKASPPPTSASTSSKKEKRSSFYMKFLEDDCPDDWFVSLDEVIAQATQTKKPRTSFQRYKSLPVNNNDVVNENNTSKTKTSNSDSILNESTHNDSLVDSLDTSASLIRSKIKRHSSSHALSPSNGNNRRRQHQ